MNHVVDLAAKHNLPVVRGHYIPTRKKAMVKDFFARFGFEKVQEDPDGRSCWALRAASYSPTKVFIEPETTLTEEIVE